MVKVYIKGFKEMLGGGFHKAKKTMSKCERGSRIVNLIADVVFKLKIHFNIKDSRWNI